MLIDSGEVWRARDEDLVRYGRYLLIISSDCDSVPRGLLASRYVVPDVIQPTGDTGRRGVLHSLQAGRPEVRHLTIEPDLAAVQVSGELDLATVGELEATVEHALTQRSVPLLIDLTGCEFIDSSVSRCCSISA
jgi:STAS domain